MPRSNEERGSFGAYNHNGFRPHQSLDLMTPDEYLAELGMAA
jgi:hypothetical protein|tara:strand:- start:9883 stop:10008 length:126 start_codon:yes stop_codon:yes gene_type:complete